MQHSDDPMGDINALVGELQARGIDGRRTLYTAYFVRFDTRERAEAALKRMSAGDWNTAFYSDADGHVVRMSRQGPLSVRRLTTDRAELHRICADVHGRWDALVIEDLCEDDVWADIVEHWFRKAATEPAVATIPQSRTSRESADAGRAVSRRRASA